ncbi:mechanosensitive ion channel family protein [Vibrio agarivorans]|uniref:Mechanosensitive ion channel family protein n=1 Tax=Vibrio agarivorans TaxID=153622 RepID=A0ABT7Y3G3_9VIBR|nr:mechanosensitive ion channel family protein [Vibrio agarivorans]MDN2482587.1 mechanosensitive ion channel family protein [Vibrio agarivorans]
MLENLIREASVLLGDWQQSVLAITIGSLIVWGLWRILYQRLDTITNNTRFSWDESLLHAAKSPISVLIWFWPATLSIGVVLDYFSDTPHAWLATIKHILLILIFIWFCTRLVGEIESHALKSEKHDPSTIEAMGKVARLFFFVIGLLTIIQSLGVSLTGLLTFGGVGGLVVGLAAKDLLSNFFGGMMIYFDRPFKIGDWIRSPDRQIEGTVERIGWRMTVIRTFDKRPLYIPNSVFSSIVVENPSRMHNRRISENIGIRYQDAAQLESIVNEVKTMLQTHPEIDTSQTLIVNFNGYGQSSLDLMIYTFTKTVNWVYFHEVKQDVLIKILAIIRRHDADIAFPTQTLNVVTQTNEEPPAQ